MKKQRLKLLETTLRDGSYVIDYQFNAQETEYIVKILDEIGFEYIEVGPGIGFNAHKYSTPKPASSDLDYIKAAKKYSSKSKIGMFFIPGIGELDNIKMSSDYGLDLIRVGTDVNRSSEGFKYLEACNKYGIETAANLMKSYAISHKQFAKICDNCHKAGADTVYLVDSAGGMMPEDVKKFLLETKNLNPDIQLGFHGHNNLGLAIANTLTAIDCGASIVDSSIRGMGRSSGNTITEKLILVLKRRGFNLQYDLNKLLDLSDKIIVNFLSNKPEKTMDMIFGYSQFHSSYLPKVNEYSKIFNINTKELIIEYTKVDKLGIDEKKLKSVAKKLSKNKYKENDLKISVKHFKDKIKHRQIHILINSLIQLKFKFNKKIYFNIAKSNKTNKISPIIHENENIAFASAEINNSKEINKIIDNLDSLIDGVLIDEKLNYSSHNKLKIFKYDDDQLFGETIFNYIMSINNNEKINLNKIYVEERKNISNKLSMLFKNNGLKFYKEKNSAELAIIGNDSFFNSDFKDFKKLKWVIVTKPGCVSYEKTKSTKIKFIRIDLKLEIFNKILEKTHYHNIFNKTYGIKKIGKNLYCSGGYLGPKGSVVVDDINNIKQNFGVSNGDGSVKYYKS